MIRPFSVLFLCACTSGAGPKGGLGGLDTQETGAIGDTGGADSDTGGSGDSTDSGAGDTGDSADTGADTGEGGCVPVTSATRTAVVTDIDETLTTSDAEFLIQIVDPSYDPAMRPDASALMSAYYALGYQIYYVTGRGESIALLDGTSARDATEAWLDAHGFPYEDSNVYLADGLGAFGSDATTYKSDVILGLQGAGITLVYAYGNATTDMDAYQAQSIEDDHIFLVGKLSDEAGTYGVEGISDDDAYTNHLASWMPGVPCGA